MDDLTAITTAKGDVRIDSRLIAQHLGIKNRSLYATLKTHQEAFQRLGILRFQSAVIDGRGQPEKYALLNEDHSFLALTFRRNTPKVCDLKVKLVKAFGEARRALSVRKQEYLPEYHALHDAIKDRAAGSPNERFLHLNANREINKLAGVQPGRRATAGRLEQSLLCIGSALAARAVMGDHDGSLHERIKNALRPLESLAALGVVDAS